MLQSLSYAKHLNTALREVVSLAIVIVYVIIILIIQDPGRW